MRLTAREQDEYARDGFVVRERLLDRDDIEALIEATEELERDLLARRKGDERRMTVGAYVFERDALDGVVLKWEPDAPDRLMGLEPVAHLHPSVEKYAFDERLLDPARDLVGSDDLVLFTEKLNMKRGHVGGPIVLHQDYPYWVGLSDDLDRVITAMVALDDSTLERGPLEVVPGSHNEGIVAGKDTDDAFARNEIDPSGYDTSRLVPVPVPAGSVIYFGARLVHRSAPNRSQDDRRAMLYTYQPAPARHAREVLGLKGATAS